LHDEAMLAHSSCDTATLRAILREQDAKRRRVTRKIHITLMLRPFSPAVLVIKGLLSSVAANKLRLTAARARARDETEAFGVSFLFVN
jgi:hypothetical protein